MRVLGIDCGSQSTGYGIVDSDGQDHRVVTFGALRLPAKNAFSQKLVEIHKKVAQLIHDYSPNFVAVEDQFYLTNFKSVLKLGQIKGAVILAAAQARVPIIEYSPLAIKNAVTGYGRAEKHQVQVMVRNILRMKEEAKPHDAADALALAICHIHTLSTQHRLKAGGDILAWRGV
jgi:crossover junction endodeoxyribonuclease RuvC